MLKFHSYRLTLYQTYESRSCFDLLVEMLRSLLVVVGVVITLCNWEGCNTEFLDCKSLQVTVNLRRLHCNRLYYLDMD